VENSSSYCALGSEQDAFLGSQPVLLQLLHTPLELRCADAALHDLSHTGAALIVLLLLWGEVISNEWCYDVEPSVCRVAKNNVRCQEIIEELAYSSRPRCGSLIMCATCSSYNSQ